MEEILCHTFCVTPADTSRHIDVPFTLNRAYGRLEIVYGYTPKNYEDNADARRQMRDCYARYGLTATAEELQAELPLKNHITLSLDAPSGSCGAAHRHANQETFFLTKETASLGLYPTAILPGAWKVTVSTHAVLSERVEVKIAVYGYDEGEGK